VRRGLAIAGVVIALVGVAVILVAFSISSGPSGSIIEGVTAPDIAGDTNYTHVIPVSPQKSATFVYSWSSTRSVQVYLYVAAACPNDTAGYVCPAGPAVQDWWSSTGSWTWSGSVNAPWLLVILNPNGTAAAYSGTMVESYPAMGTYTSGLELFVLIIASVVLLGLGALALFLGLFLRGGIYGPPRTPVGPPDAGILRRPGDDDLEEEWQDEPPSHDGDDDY
jgi:hypothetical protein